MAQQYDGRLCNEGILISIDAVKRKFAGPKFRQLLHKFTLVTPQKIGPPKRAKLYKYLTRNGSQYMCFPRSTMHMFSKHNIFNIKLALPVKPRVLNKFTGELDPNQTIILGYLMKNVYTRAQMTAGLASTTLQLTAGYGKTFVGIGLIAALQTRTLVVVPANSDLAAQWLGCCEGYLTGTSVLYNNKKDILGDVTIIMISTAIKKPAEWFKKFGLVIYDEVHMYCSPVWGDIFWRTNVKCVLGLTATPSDRRDKFDEVFMRHVGEVLYANTIPGFQSNDIEFKGIVDVIEYSGHPEHTQHHENPATGRLDANKLVKQLNNDPLRNKLIVEETKRLYNLHLDEGEIAAGNSHPDKPLSIYVFCTFRSHVQLLEKMLQEADMDVYAPELGGAGATTPTATAAAPTAPTVKVMMGGVKRDDVEDAKRARITLTTFKFSGTGISVVEKTAMLFASPLKSGFKQIVARILRKGSDYDVVRRVTDIVDTQTALRHQFRERIKAYKLYGFDIEYREVGFEDQYPRSDGP